MRSLCHQQHSLILRSDPASAGARLEGRYSLMQHFRARLPKEPIMDNDDTTHVATPPATATVEALIERWWADHFPGSPVAQVTHAWNHAFAAKEELKHRLQKFATDPAKR